MITYGTYLYQYHTCACHVIRTKTRTHVVLDKHVV